MFMIVNAASALPVDISFHDSISPHDHTVRGHALQADRKRAFSVKQAELSDYAISKVNTLVNSGPANNRLNVVLVGDGFSAAELDVYHQVVNNILAEFFRSDEIFAQYKNFINIHVLDLVSPESESGAQSFPLGSMIGCGPSRLLCVNTESANAVSAAAPGTDQVMVLAKTSEYGGAGYLASNVSAVAALNEYAHLIINHEFGHAFVKLADEYADSTSGITNVSEISFPNISALNSDSMQETREKWFRWIGAVDPNKSIIGTYEGAAYQAQGLYRATADSKMRTLGKVFNLPSREAAIKKIYEKVSLIDSVTINKGKLLISGPVTSSVQVSWKGGKAEKVCSGKRSCSLMDILGNSKTASFSLQATDKTLFVRDEEFRAAKMTSIVKVRLRARANGKIVLSTL